MKSSTSLFLGILLITSSQIAFSAETNQVIEAIVENWSKKHLPLGGTFEKVIFTIEDLKPYENELRKRKNRFDKKVQEHFSGNKIESNITYSGEKSISSNKVPLENECSVGGYTNYANSPASFKVDRPVINDVFKWTLDSPLSNKLLINTITANTINSAKKNVQVTYDNKFNPVYTGTVLKNENISITTTVPAMSSAEIIGTLIKEYITQYFTMTIKMKIKFGILYKNALGKWKIKYCDLSDVFPTKNAHDGAVIFKREGTFTGNIATHMDLEIIVTDSNTAKKSQLDRYSIPFDNLVSFW